MTPQPSVHLAERAGRMTAAMRALDPSHALALRIAVVRDGRLVEERVFKQPIRVTVGANERATFTLPARDAPKTVVLFERDGARELGMRGRVVFGKTTLLFQVVAVPPSAPRARLPASVLRREPPLDFATTLIAALAFLLHFGALGALYSDWVDPVLGDGVSISAVVETLRTPPAPPVETATTDETSPTAPTAASKATATGARSQSSSAASLSSELDRIAMGIVPALGGDGPATSGVLQSSEVPTAALDAAAASADGVSGPGTLALGPSGQPLRPGEQSGLRDLGRTARLHAHDRGERAAVRAPVGTAELAPPTTTGRIDDAARVVAGLRAGFRQCYVRGLDVAPDAQGSIRLTLRVGPNGDVSQVGAAPSGNLPATMVSCVQGRAAAAQFGPPEGGSAVVVVPVIFRNQR